MKIKFLIVFLFEIISLNLNAQTQVSGAITNNTTWTKANSPYIITSNVLVQENVNLNIEPGVIIESEEDSGIVLRGSLSAIGETNDSIVFLPSNNLKWEGIVADKNFSPKIDLAFVKAEKARVFIDIINESTSTDTILRINNCLFEKNGHVIISEDFQNHFCEINNSSFINNTYYAFLYTGHSTIKNSEFHNCEKALYNSDQTVTTVENCIFTGHDRAIAINGVVKNSEFYNNNRAIVTMNSDSPELRFNHIYNNNRGIETWTYQTSNPEDQIMYNKICNNDYNIWQRYTGTSYVMNNCWCTTDEDEIAEKIYDLFDDTSLGIVEFSPFDSTCSFLTTSTDDSLSKDELSNLIHLFPNPTNTFLTIDFQTLNSNVDELIIFNSIGKSINLNYTIQSKSILINGEKLQSGCYFVGLKIGKYWIYKRFIKN